MMELSLVIVGAAALGTVGLGLAVGRRRLEPREMFSALVGLVVVAYYGSLPGMNPYAFGVALMVWAAAYLWAVARPTGPSQRGGRGGGGDGVGEGQSGRG